jgi:hypothetical protein
MKEETFLGANGFIWWLGVVESRQDPLNLGRCQIRVHGWHTDDMDSIPSEDLPWAQPVFSPNNSKEYKSPYEGDWVVGFYMDGMSGQVPMYFGVLPGVPAGAPVSGKGFSDQGDSNRPTSPYADQPPGPYPSRLNEPTSSRLYRNEEIDTTIIQAEKDAAVSGVDSAGVSWSQPVPSYAAIPPYNDVKQTESGHVLEFDDTPSAERIHLAHRKGTYLEIRPDGTQVTRIVADNYEVISGSNFVSIKGTCNITVNGDANISVGGNAVAKVGGNADVNVSGDATASVGGKADVKVGGDANVQVGGNITTKAGGNYNITAGGTFSVSASTINLN